MIGLVHHPHHAAVDESAAEKQRLGRRQLLAGRMGENLDDLAADAAQHVPIRQPRRVGVGVDQVCFRSPALEFENRRPGFRLPHLQEAIDRGMKRLGQERQQELSARGLIERRLESRVGLAVDGMDAEDVSFRLERSPQDVGASAGGIGDDEELDGRVREDLLEIADKGGFETATPEELVSRLGSGIGDEAVAAIDEGAGDVESVGMIADKCETQANLTRRHRVRIGTKSGQAARSRRVGFDFRLTMNGPAL